MITVIAALIISLAGCGGGREKPSTERYTLKISLDGGEIAGSSVATFKTSSYVSMGIGAAAEPVVKDASWYKAKTAEDHLFGCDFLRPSAVRNAGAQATIYDAEGNPVVLPYEEAEASIVWTCSDLSKIELSVGDNNLTGDSVGFVALDTGVLIFTATYTYTVEGEVFVTTAKANVIIINRPMLDIPGTDPNYPDGFDFITGTGTTLANSDIYITKEDGVNYINAPGGISKILGLEYLPQTGTETTISPYSLGSILQVPADMTFVTKIPAENFVSYIIRPRSGVGYAKIFNLISPTEPIARNTAIQYEYSADGEFNLHW